MEKHINTIKPSRTIFPSNKDIMVLEELLQGRNIQQLSQPESYHDVVVMKPWGYEFLVYQNDCVSIWFLHINKSHSTSMHCHPCKLTSLIVLTGDALCNTFRHRNFISKGNCLILNKGVFHCTKALSQEGINLLEIETPSDKLDLVRLNDGYGRSNHGYEGLSQMEMEDLEKYDYFYFTEEMFPKEVNFTKQDEYVIKLRKFYNTDELLKYLKANPRTMFCVCKGFINNIDGNSIINVGEVQPGAVFKDVSQLAINNEIQIMELQFYK